MQSLLSQLLITEHDVILDAGDFISLNGDLWKTNPEEYEQNVKQLLNFFSVYADEYHHQKEEEILFPAISKKSETVAAGIVEELLEHHENFRLLIRQIKTTLVNKDFSKTQQLFEKYINLLKDHIAVENDELFPMADDIFNYDELDKLYHKCIDKDREIGTSRKEEFGSRIKNITINEADRSDT